MTLNCEFEMQVFNQFRMTYEMATWLKTRAERGVAWWVKHPDPELTEELLDTMRLFVEAAEFYSTIDAGSDDGLFFLPIVSTSYHPRDVCREPI